MAKGPCQPCKVARAMRQAKENRTLRGAFAGCEHCKQGMADMEEKRPRLARVVRPVHNYLTDEQPKKRRVLGSK